MELTKKRGLRESLKTAIGNDSFGIPMFGAFRHHKGDMGLWLLFARFAPAFIEGKHTDRRARQNPRNPQERYKTDKRDCAFVSRERPCRCIEALYLVNDRRCHGKQDDCYDDDSNRPANTCANCHFTLPQLTLLMCDKI